MPLGAPGTNLTLPPSVAARIESTAAVLEGLNPYPTGLARNREALEILNGSWRLRYSNAPEITSLASLPLGFQLGEVFQPVDVTKGIFENQALVKQSLGLAEGSTRVVGAVRAGPLGSLNAAGIRNVAGNRLDVDFLRVFFALDQVLGSRTDDLKTVVSPRVKPQDPQPAIDITYLDRDLRITRGGDAALFVLTREESPLPLLDAGERASLFSEGSVPVVAAAGLGNWSQTVGKELITSGL